MYRGNGKRHKIWNTKFRNLWFPIRNLEEWSNQWKERALRYDVLVDKLKNKLWATIKKEEDQEKQKEEENHEEKFRRRMEEELEIDLRPATLLKKRLWHRCFPVDFVKFLRLLRTPFSQNTSWWLLLNQVASLKSLGFTWERIANLTGSFCWGCFMRHTLSGFFDDAFDPHISSIVCFLVDRVAKLVYIICISCWSRWFSSTNPKKKLTTFNSPPYWGTVFLIRV